MNEIDKMQYAIELGWTANPDTGEIKTHKGKNPKTNCSGYTHCSIGINSKTFSFRGHRFVWFMKYGKLPENQLDHINGNRSDNRITNLRDVTNQGNSFNQIKTKGCYWDKNAKKWQAQIILNYKKIYLGLFNTEDEAHNAYLEAKKIYHKI